jgi:formylglycine-generating enzyme
MAPQDPRSEAPTLPLGLDGEKREAPALDGALGAIHPGTLLAGRYRLTEVLGQGGMSRVFKADDHLSSPTGSSPAPAVIAIKALSEDVTGPAGRFAALTAHVNRLRRLTHPHIVTLFGCERDGAIAFITMEFLPGESAFAKLQSGAPGSPAFLPASDARHIVAMIADALQYAHAQGVVHGDLKPGNVMLSPAYGAKLIDFGMIRWRAHAGGAETAISLGATPRYASPELLAGEEPHPSDDVFGLACLAYELLTGVAPFDRATSVSTVRPAPPNRPGITAVEYEALLHALQPARQQRTSSVREFMAEFAAPGASSSARKRLYAGFAAAAVIVAAVVIAAFTRHKGGDPSSNAVQPAAPIEASQSAAPAPASAPVAVRPGATIKDCATCPLMTVLARGEFQQGAPDEDRDAAPLERPYHRVRIDYPIAVSTADITVDDFKRFVEATRRDMNGCDIYDGNWRHRASARWQQPGFTQTARHPVVCVSWNDAVAYADWLSKTTDHQYRLPSASEWEYAARAGTSMTGWRQDSTEICASANVADRAAERRYPGWQVFPCDDGYVYTAPVGSFGSNSFGLSDVIGNVLVWTQDCWVPHYSGAPSDGTARKAAACSEHEVRGGSWFSPPAVVRASYRNHFKSDYRTSSLGIRLVREISP